MKLKLTFKINSNSKLYFFYKPILVIKNTGFNAFICSNLKKYPTTKITKAYSIKNTNFDIYKQLKMSLLNKSFRLKKDSDLFLYNSVLIIIKLGIICLLWKFLKSKN